MRGGNLAWLAKVQAEKGIRVKAIEAVPKLLYDVTWIWNGFQFLSSRRSYGFAAPNPISVEAMKAYVDLAGIVKDDDIDFYLRIIPKMDDIWMDDWSQRADKEKARKERENKNKRR